MAGTVFERLANHIAGLPNKLAMAYAANVIRTVDKYAEMFKNSVEQQTPFATGALRNSLTLTRQFKNGKYGYRVEFHGYNEWGEPFQVIANTLNRGMSVTDANKAVSADKHINFISRNLAILRELNPDLARNMIIGGWSVTDESVTLNDGTKFSMQDLENFEKILQQYEE